MCCYRYFNVNSSVKINSPVADSNAFVHRNDFTLSRQHTKPHNTQGTFLYRNNFLIANLNLLFTKKAVMQLHISRIYLNIAQIYPESEFVMTLSSNCQQILNRIEIDKALLTHEHAIVFMSYSFHFLIFWSVQNSVTIACLRLAAFFDHAVLLMWHTHSQV